MMAIQNPLLPTLPFISLKMHLKRYLKKDSTIKDEFSFLINDDLNLISASDPSLFSNNLAIQALQSDPSASGQFQLVNYREFSAYTACFPLKKYRLVYVFPDPQKPGGWYRPLRCN